MPVQQPKISAERRTKNSSSRSFFTAVSIPSLWHGYSAQILVWTSVLLQHGQTQTLTCCKGRSQQVSTCLAQHSCIWQVRWRDSLKAHRTVCEKAAGLPNSLQGQCQSTTPLARPPTKQCHVSTSRVSINEVSTSLTLGQWVCRWE